MTSATESGRISMLGSRTTGTLPHEPLAAKRSRCSVEIAPLASARKLAQNWAMQAPLIQVDAFTQELFSGNPAAVCPLLEWPTDSLMQAIAAENNLSETAFVVPVPDRYRLRWFTPKLEVALCGHATLAAAHVVMRHLRPELTEVTFDTRSGPLIVVKDGERFTMDFPRVVGKEAPPDPAELEALGGPRPVQSFLIERPPAPSYRMLVYETAGEVAALEPDFARLTTNVIVTAEAREFDREFDFVSRYFAPASGIYEDPVTGSAHCSLAPYWAERLGKTELVGRQISARGGTVYCKDTGERVQLGGYCVEYSVGSIQLPKG